ncbi:hypothetical protein KSP39_PZI020185 [Platanthera zijinensis]|uniref:Uncharacterized protein n=1 Tax=Platanthera zijinensis TaxID=2320716 RepID=A0AAP0B028_9ASPA
MLFPTRLLSPGEVTKTPINDGEQLARGGEVREAESQKQSSNDHVVEQNDCTSITVDYEIPAIENNTVDCPNEGMDISIDAVRLSNKEEVRKKIISGAPAGSMPETNLFFSEGADDQSKFCPTHDKYGWAGEGLGCLGCSPVAMPGERSRNAVTYAPGSLQ